MRGVLGWNDSGRRCSRKFRRGWRHDGAGVVRSFRLVDPREELAMRWGGDEVGVVLTRNEVWLLLHALAGSKLPAVDWEGNALEPWVVGELRARLQAALRPDPLSDVEERPIIRLDSDMGRSLAMAEVRPLVIEDGYDLGSLFAACAERGWGATLTLPVGGGVETPAQAKVTVGNRQWAKGNSDESQAVVRGPQAEDG